MNFSVWSPHPHPIWHPSRFVSLQIHGITCPDDHRRRLTSGHVNRHPPFAPEAIRPGRHQTEVSLSSPQNSLNLSCVSKSRSSQYKWLFYLDPMMLGERVSLLMLAQNRSIRKSLSILWLLTTLLRVMINWNIYRAYVFHISCKDFNSVAFYRWYQKLITFSLYN